MKIARNALKRAPLLIPIFNRCYIPCHPSLTGNPIFYVDENQIFCCGSDLSDFFERESLFRSSDPTEIKNLQSSSVRSSDASRRSLDISSSSGRKAPPHRWIEFWSDAAVDRRRRNSSSSSSSSPDRLIEMPKWGIPKWVEDYVSSIGSVLRQGGWSESDVKEITEVSGSGFFEDEEMVLLDKESVLDALLLKADRFSSVLRKSGWSPEDVSEAFGLDFRKQPEKGRRPELKLSPELAEKISKLAESVTK